MKSSLRISEVALVAADMSYSAGNGAFLQNTDLRPYDDTDPAISPSFSADRKFKVIKSHIDLESGFKYLLFRHEATHELIVAFAGTDGIDYRDWGSNALALGWNQWSRNKQRVFLDIGEFARDAPAIHFTGQSLGGALAEYATYEWLAPRSPQDRATEQARTTLTTFNGLGSEDVLRSRFGESFDHTILGAVAQSAAYWVRNDIVARLGGGHSGVPVYKLDHLSYRQKPWFRQTRDDQYWDLGPVDAHRIEFGLYSGRRTGGEFEPSAVYDSAAFEPLEIAMTESQRASRLSAAVFNGKFRNNTEAAATIVAGLIGAAMHGSADEVTKFSREILRSLNVSGAYAVDESRAMALRDNLFYLLENLPLGNILKTLASVNHPNLLALQGGAILAALGARHIDPGVFRVPFEQILNVVLQPLALENSGALPHLYRGIVQWGVMSPWSDRAKAAMEGAGVELSDIAAATLRSDAEWLYDTQSQILLRAASTIRGQVADPGEQAQQISTQAVDLVAWLEGERARFAELDPTYAATLRRQIVDFTSLDVAQALVNTRDVLQPVVLAHASAFGGTQLDFASYDRYRDAIADAVDDPSYSHIRDLLESAIGRIESGGERIAVASIGSGNPFDSANFTGEDAVSSASLVEGRTRSFTLFLPYAADAGGQRISLRLAGPSAASFAVADENGPLVLQADGTFRLSVAEGRREIAFSVRAQSDVDVDSALTLSAQLTDDGGTATHQRHDEIRIAFDATIEPSTNPTTAVTGTAQDDNRSGDAAHRPVNGGAAADHIRALAGRDEAAGFTGDDLIEGGTGADVLAGDEGADRIFADAAMDDAALRSYMATTAAIIDNTHASSTSDASAADWMVGDLGDDTLVGSAAADLLFGGGGSDLIVGGAGHDIIDGDDDYRPGALTGVQAVRAYQGRPHQLYFSSVIWNQLARNVGAGDQIHGGAGDDFVRALYGDDTVFGDNGDDTIAGDAGDDSLFGNAGNDRIAGGAYGSDDALTPSGNDYIDGGDGNDILSGESGADVILGGAGDDLLHGFIGTTFVGAPNEAPASDGEDYLSGGGGADILIGASGADTLVGGDHADQLFGDSDQTPEALQGNDDLDGGAGDDYLRGYGGDDRLRGGTGNDVIHGENGADHVDGGIDDDSLFGMDGDDTLLGGAGEDELVGDNGADVLDGAIDDDQLWGGAGDDRLEGGSGNDYLDGGEGVDNLAGAHGADWIYARAGDDVADGGVDNDVVVGGDGNDALAGGDGDDQLWGENDADTLTGDVGNDQLIGGAGSDALDGGEGLDQLWGEGGDDTLSGGAGRDYLLGGAGNDVYLVDSSTEDVIVDSEGQNAIRFSNDVVADELRFRQGVDAAGVDRYLVIEGVGTRGRVIVRGGMEGAIARYEFDDGTSISHAQVMAQLAAQGVADKKPVGATAPTIRYGTTANELIADIAPNSTVYAGSGDDTVTGTSGAETLNGDAGADRLDGSIGNDILVGGEGTDTYVFGRDRGRDTIEERFISQAGAAQTDTVEMVTGVLPADVTLHRNGVDLVLAINQTAAQLRVREHFLPTERVLNPATGQQEFWPSDRRIERIHFANGTVWDAAAIAARTIAGAQNTANGTSGNDVFAVDSHDDIVNESPNAGDDTIQSSVSFALRPNIERLTLTGFVDTNAWSNTANPTSHLVGNAGNNTFNGPGTYFNGSTQVVATSGATMGYAVMSGAGGDDVYHLRDTVGGQVIEIAGQGYDTIVLNGPNWHSYQLPVNVEAVISAEGGAGIVGTTRIRIGNALDNYIEGSRTGVPGTSLDNIIDGGAGADTMVGFDDNDRFIVDNARDLALDRGVFTNGSQASTQDEVQASVSYELPDNIEIIRLTGAAGITARGNDLANTLDGSTNAASNALAGGLGDDRYVANANDTIVERPGEGIDIVEWRGTGSRIYTALDLPAEVEGIALGDDLGDAGYAGDARFDRVAGNAGRNVLDGGGGDDRLEGGAGDDTLVGGAGNDQLNGGAGYDVLRFSRGSGHDAAYGDTSFEIAFDSSVAVADLRFVDGHLEIADSADRIDVGSSAPNLRFADGTFLAQNEVFSLLAASRSTTPSAAADMLTGTDAGDALDALAGDDFVYGRAGADVLTGGDGNDRLYGEAGNDTLAGDAGNDQVDGGVGDDLARGGTGNDTIRGGVGRDHVDGQQGDDMVYGDDDDDVVSGGGGYDTLYGGAGKDVLTLAGGSGAAFGDAGDDRLLGGDDLDFLSGGTGDDVMNGGAADDSLSGEDGVDTYVLSRGGGFDLVQDWALNGELTIVEVATGVAPIDIALERVIDEYDTPTLSVRIADAADGLQLPYYGRADRPLEIRFADGTVWTPAMVLDRLSRVDGTDLDDVLTGSPGDDALYGRAGSDTLAGLAGSDTLDGGTGADRLEGGVGNDRYVVDDAGDVIAEFADEGVDTVESTLSLTLAADVENLTLLGAALNATGNALGNTLVGNAAANILDGRQGNDTMRGSAGNDTYVVDASLDTIVENAGEGTDTVSSAIAYTLGANLENLTLTGGASIGGNGNASVNVLVGNAGANLLDGRAGADTMRGAAGNDTYVVDTLSDVVVESASEGTDTIQAALTYTLGANLENLTLTGTAASNGTGNLAANTVIGNAAANLLDGAAGNDSLRGGAGNDTYIVDSTSDSVVENASEGTDAVNASASFTLGVNVENLTLTGAAAINATGNAQANVLVGNGAANTLNGGAGADTMRGGVGNDVYVVDIATDVVTENATEGTDTIQSSVAWTLGANVENLVLTGAAAVNGTGNGSANSLTGNGAVNVLDGGAGADVLAGGAGNDTYIVDNLLDVVTEGASAGTDSVTAAVSFMLAANVESLTLTGAAATNGTGNALANTLQGNAAANVMDGGAGADTLRGGAGNDTFVVDTAVDVVIENAAEGDDTIRSYVAWTLGANVENLTLAGTAAINGTGNTTGNWLLGNAAANALSGVDGQDLIFGAAGNDILAGGNGRDILQGGDGNDTLGDTAGNNVLHGGLGIDALTGGPGAELFAGGGGNDTLTVSAGADIVAFNRGDGQDIVGAAIGADNTLTLGGGIRYADVALQKAGNDLIVAVGATEQLTFKDWYLATSNRHVVDLQMIVDASVDWNAASTNALLNKRVARFDFAGLVSQFDAARTANPALTQWAVAGALASEHLGGSDTAAMGGDLAYQYGRGGALANMGWTPADAVLASASFGVAMQTLQSPATLFGGPKTLS